MQVTQLEVRDAVFSLRARSLRKDVSSQLQGSYVLDKANLLLLQGFSHNYSKSDHSGMWERHDYRCHEQIIDANIWKY